MTRSLRVEFVPVHILNEVSHDPEIHDVSLPDGVADVPEVLENPHVDFPGTWALMGEGADGAHRYQRIERVANTSDTAAG